MIVGPSNCSSKYFGLGESVSGTNESHKDPYLGDDLLLLGESERAAHCWFHHDTQTTHVALAAGFVSQGSYTDNS